MKITSINKNTGTVDKAELHEFAIDPTVKKFIVVTMGDEVGSDIQTAWSNMSRLDMVVMMKALQIQTDDWIKYE